MRNIISESSKWHNERIPNKPMLCNSKFTHPDTLEIAKEFVDHFKYGELTNKIYNDMLNHCIDFSEKDKEALHEYAIKKMSKKEIKKKDISKTDMSAIQNSLNIAEIIAEKHDFYVPDEYNKAILLYVDGHYKKKKMNYIDGYIMDYFTKNKLNEILTDGQQITKINAIKRYLKHLKRCELDDFDIEKNKINLGNGVIDLDEFKKTGKIDLLPHDPKYKFLRIIRTKYDKNATCPNLDKFLNEILHPEDIEYVEEILGYSLTTWVKYQLGFLLYGKGHNGKTTLLNVLGAFVGNENVSGVDLINFFEGTFLFSKIAHKLLNIKSEIDTQKKINITTVKTYIGGEGRIVINDKNKAPYDIQPTAKVIISCNDDFPILPETAGKGFFRKWKLIETPNNFDEKDDSDLINKLTTPEELSGLLNRALKGMKRLMDRGNFDKPDWVDVKNLWLYRVSPFNMFVEECCEIGKYEDAQINPDNRFWIVKDDLVNIFNQWRLSKMRNILTKTKITQWINQNPLFNTNNKRKIQRGDSKTQVPVYTGFRVKEGIEERLFKFVEKAKEITSSGNNKIMDEFVKKEVDKDDF